MSPYWSFTITAQNDRLSPNNNNNIIKQMFITYWIDNVIGVGKFFNFHIVATNKNINNTMLIESLLNGFVRVLQNWLVSVVVVVVVVPTKQINKQKRVKFLITVWRCHRHRSHHIYDCILSYILRRYVYVYWGFYYWPFHFGLFGMVWVFVVAHVRMVVLIAV